MLSLSATDNNLNLQAAATLLFSLQTGMLLLHLLEHVLHDMLFRLIVVVIGETTQLGPAQRESTSVADLASSCSNGMFLAVKCIAATQKHLEFNVILNDK